MSRLDTESLAIAKADLPSSMSTARSRSRTLRRVPLLLLATMGIAHAADIPIVGTYGTVTMCIIDAFTDVPSAEINYNVGGAPLARVMPGEFDLPTQSCVLRSIVSTSVSGAKSHWIVEADCTTDAGNVARVLDIASDKTARSVTVAEKN